MISKLNIYNRKFLLTTLILIISTSIYAQKNIEIWESLLNNDRQSAIEKVNNLQIENDLENFTLLKIVEMENGIMSSSDDYLINLSNYDDYENYLFANWMMPYVFNNYLDNGYNKKSYELPSLLEPTEISNSTIKNALYYLQGVTERHKRDWGNYLIKMNNINTIKQWELCGVFENLNSSGIDIAYLPEKEASNDVIFDAQSKGWAKWYLQPNNQEVYGFFTNHIEYGSGVHYAQTFITSPIDQRVNLRIGKGGLIRVWLNDVLVLENDDDNITEMDSYTYSVNLQKGVNRVLVKMAKDSGSPYFILRLEDLVGNPLKNYSESFENRNYKKGNIQSVNPEFLPHSVISFFENRLNRDIGDKNLNKFCLSQALVRTGRVEEAVETLKDWLLNYPNSSLIKSALIECYSKLGEETSENELTNNMKRLDPDYYLSLMMDFEDSDGLMKLDLPTYEEKLNKIGNSVDYSFMESLAELMILFRTTGNKVEMESKLDEVLNDINLFTTFKPSFTEFYSTLFNDDDKTISTLEKFNNEEYSWEIITYLAYYYEKQNRIEEAIALYDESIEKFGYDNNSIYKQVLLLHETGQYERSLEYINKALENFPNSHVYIEFKGDVYLQVNEINKAIEYYEKALKSSPSDLKLRTKINDLKKLKNPLVDFHLNKPYEYIQKNRNIIKENNYGINVLINQTDVLNYLNGGGEYKVTLLYEITSQNGIDILKEYNLGLSGNYVIHKSEIVKPNGSTVPADKNNSNLVFDKLEIGDVVYLDYETNYIRNGRFYKDYILNHNFNSYHPTLKKTYRVLTHDKELKYLLLNGEVGYNIYKNGEYYVHEFSNDFTPSLEISEDYMPPFTDITTKLMISSIGSWDEIANWYSDVVKNQLKFDKTVADVFSTIFPNGFNQLSEDERARRIYYYITDNLSYSHVSFRQGGFIPQKPSKTITTKLGDCKDFSSLFLILARKANLDTRMILILTSNNGKNELLMPSTDFNHCIVKVNINGIDQYLELTNKYLPYKSLPISLRYATALEIPFDSNDSTISEMFYLENVQRIQAGVENKYFMELEMDVSKLNMESKVSGHLASYYIELFNNKNGDLLIKDLEDDILSQSSESIELKEIESYNHDKNEGAYTYETKLEVDLKVDKIGDIFTFKIPYFTNPYTEDIISKESRSYEIDYKQYETADFYKETISILLNEEYEFIDIPENVNYQYKGHSFDLEFKLKNPNEIIINILSKVNGESISINEYSEFKKFVKKVLETRKTSLKFQ